MGDYPKAIENYLRAALECVIDGGAGTFWARPCAWRSASGDKAAFKQSSRRSRSCRTGQIVRLTAPCAAAADQSARGTAGRGGAAPRGAPAEAGCALFQKDERDSTKPYFLGWNTLMALAKTARRARPTRRSLSTREAGQPAESLRELRGTALRLRGPGTPRGAARAQGDLDRAEKPRGGTARWNPSWAPTKPAERSWRSCAGRRCSRRPADRKAGFPDPAQAAPPRDPLRRAACLWGPFRMKRPWSRTCSAAPSASWTPRAGTWRPSARGRAPRRGPGRLSAPPVRVRRGGG